MNNNPASPESTVYTPEPLISAAVPGNGVSTAPGSGNGGSGFWALIVTQFQGAFSDNTLKWLTTYLIMQMDVSMAKRNWLIGLVTALFTVPFILFSMTGGFLADRFSKRTIIIAVKMFEIVVMSCA